jgi:phosphopantothenoylcysteine decarboxylase/phosphopantothenate--cysteine ligase
LDRAVRKAASYSVDFLVANDVTLPGSGFGTDTNQVSIISPDGSRQALALMTKREVSAEIWSRVADLRGDAI